MADQNHRCLASLKTLDTISLSLFLSSVRANEATLRHSEVNADGERGGGVVKGPSQKLRAAAQIHRMVLVGALCKADVHVHGRPHGGDGALTKSGVVGIPRQ